MRPSAAGSRQKAKRSSDLSGSGQRFMPRENTSRGDNKVTDLLLYALMIETNL
jgi:hypothetical protein